MLGAKESNTNKISSNSEKRSHRFLEEMKIKFYGSPE